MTTHEQKANELADKYKRGLNDYAEQGMLSVLIARQIFDDFVKDVGLANLLADKERLEKAEILLREHKIFVASIQGGLYGLTTHPTDKPLNGHLITPPSMEKLKRLYGEVIKERQAIDSAIAKKGKI